VSFSVDRRHWAFALVLFALNIAGLILTVSKTSVVFDGRTVLLMIACSAMMSFLAAFVIIALFDAISPRSKSK
jgi:Ni,Fe-hydrogenase I cytochrome b subunit